MHRSLFSPRVRLILGGSILGAIVIAAVFAPWIAPHDPYKQNLGMRMLPPFFMSGGRPEMLLGSDAYGRDLLSRIIYGSRISLLVGLAAMIFSCALGTIAGLVAGFKGGVAEQVIMRLADAHLSFPDILLAIIITAALGGSTINLIIVLGVSSWMLYARVIYGMTRTLRERSFVEAARSFGGADWYIMMRHILPQMVPVLIAVATLQVAQLILQETALSFLGLGLPPPAATLGNILAEGRDRIFVAPWIANSAGIAIIVLVWAINMLGSGLQQSRT